MQDFDKINELVTNNMGLAYFHAGRFRNLDFNDALSSAMDGLWNAAKTFNAEKKIPFGSFASLHIKWKLKRLREFVYRMKRDPYKEQFSLDAPIYIGENSSYGERIEDEESPNIIDEICNTDNGKMIMNYFNVLNDREKDIISLYFGLNKKQQTASEIASKYKISKTRIIKIKEKALEKLRNKLLISKKNK